MTYRNTKDITVSINFMGEDFIAHIEYVVTHHGHPSNGWDDPGEGPEWEIDEIYLSLDLPGDSGPMFRATGALLDHLANNVSKINEKIAEAIGERDDEPEYDEDYYRDR